MPFYMKRLVIYLYHITINIINIINIFVNQNKSSFDKPVVCTSEIL